MEEIVLQAEPRTVIGKQVKQLRRQGRLPAVLYGATKQPILVTLDQREASRILSTITSSHLVTVAVNDEKHTALVRERQREPVLGHLLHVDFLVVSMTEKLRATVVLVLEGDAPAVKNYNGVLVTGVENIEVESLPGDLPERITVDITGLNEIGNAIYVRDLQLSSAVEILTDKDEMIILVTAPAAEEVVEAEPVEGEPEVVAERGKKEEEE